MAKLRRGAQLYATAGAGRQGQAQFRRNARRDPRMGALHVCKRETLYEAYRMAKENDGAPGIDGVTFAAIQESGVERYLEQIREELVSNTYRPMRARKKEIPKDGGKKVRVLSIPAIRDRVVQGALKLILEPIFEADFQSGSYGYRPKRTAHQAVNRVAQAIVEEKTRIIDIDLRAYLDTYTQCSYG